MRSGKVFMLTLTAALFASCVQEGNKTTRGAEDVEQSRPVEEAAAPTSNEEKLRSLGTEADPSEAAPLCLRLRAAYASGSLPSDLGKQCARSMLALAESAESTSKSADEWLGLAAEFGASSAAIKKAKREIAATQARREAAQVESSGAEVENERYANREDVKQAKQFLASLPEACGGSRASAARDGTVTIRLYCEGNNKSMRGSIKIKDGIVTEIQ